MPRFRNLRTGAVVNVEEKPGWDEWESLEAPALPSVTPPVDPVATVPPADPVAPEAVVAPEVTDPPVTPPVDPNRPNNGASRKIWAEYVTAKGEDPGELTRDELIAAFG